MAFTPRPRNLLFCLVLTVAAYAASPTASTVAPPWPHEQSDIAPSASVTWGKLDNGLRYAILPNTTPAKHVSLRLLVESGSLQESDAQRGYAHFVEHMAFNGTEHFPAGELVTFLQRSGVGFGAHVNASTNYTRTFYMLDLPDNSAGIVDKGVRILRDFAGGILFEPAEVDRERGVILSEDLARQSTSLESTIASNRLLYAGTLIPDRLPIGTETSIKNATTESLRAFYDTWYRPERMVVIVTGEIDAAQAQTLIRQYFASLTARSPAIATPAIGSLTETTGPTAAHYKKIANSTVSISNVAPQDATADTKEARLKRHIVAAALSMLDRRLKHIQQTADSTLTSADIRYLNASFHAFQEVTLVLNSEKSDWKKPLQIAEQELRKALVYGFDQTELDEVKQSARSTFEAAAKAVPTTQTNALANQLGDTIHNNLVYLRPDEAMPLQLATLERFTVADCRQALEDFCGRAQLKILVAAREFDPRFDEKVVAAYKASQETPVTAPEALKPVEFAYKDFGAPGEVVMREHIADLDLWQVRFANGVRLNLKKTDFARNAAAFMMRIGTGRAEEPSSQPGLALWTSAIIEGGVGRHTREELQRAVSGRGINLLCLAGDDAFTFLGSWRADEIPTALRFTTAYVTDPAFRPEAERRIQNALKRTYGTALTTPTGAINASIIPFLTGGDPRLGLPSYKRVFGCSLDELKAWLAPALDKACVEIAIVGDIDIDATISEVAKTLGTLPPRSPKPDLSAKKRLKFPQPPAEKSYSFTGTKRPALIDFVWPVRDPLTPADRVRLNLLATLLQDRLRVKIREQLGEAYSPQASFSHNRVYPGFSYLTCQMDIQPDHTGAVAGAVRELVVSLAQNGTTDEEIARLKLQSLTGTRARLRSNAYLASALAAAQEYPERLDELRNLEADLDRVTKADLDAFAARYLTAQNTFLFTVKPKPPKK